MHVGLIIDGARRWARREGIGLTEAYARTLSNVEQIIKQIFDNGGNAVSVYLLSRDNLQRSERDLASVFDATADFLGDAMLKLGRDGGVGFAVAGDPSAVPVRYRAALEALISGSPTSSAAHRVYLLVAYSPAEELAARWRPGLMTMAELIPELWVPERVDLVIRTGGVALLSDFLPLQCGYARIYCSPLSFAEITWNDIRDEVASIGEKDSLRGR